MAKGRRNIKRNRSTISFLKRDEKPGRKFVGMGFLV
jgi:hypothetical protein